MASFLNSISAVLLILMMVAVGYAFGSFGWMKSEHKPFLTKLLIYICMPCMCVYNVFNSFSIELVRGSGMLLVVAAVFNVCMYAASLLLAKALRVPRVRFGGFVVMCAMSNSLFVGYPVCLELFGEAGIPFMMCFYIVNTTTFWAIGAPLIYHCGDGGKKLTPKAALKRMASPPLVALLIAVPLLLLGFELPHIVFSFTRYMSNAVTPLALVYVGFLIYETGLKNLKPDGRIWAMCGMRFAFAPALMLLLCSAFALDADVSAVYMIEAAMPVMTQSVVVCAFAGTDEKYNALGMSLTSLLCLAVIPVLMLLVK